MVRLYNKTKIASAVTLAVAAPVAFLAAANIRSADAAEVPFNVEIPEVITMTIGEPSTWASGDVDTLLKNKITVTAQTNNSVGVTVSMYTNNTNLVNQTDSSYTIPTLSNNYTVANFPTNYWGYSKDDATYAPLSTSAIGILSTTTGTSKSQDVYFGAKASSSKVSGTYAQTVYFTAVTGTVNTDTPVTPSVDPTTPDPINENPTYVSTTGSSSGSTRYTTRSTSGSGTSSTTGEKKTTTSQVSSGNTTSSYAAAQGVTSSTSSINGGASVATALGVAAAVAATSGTIFFLLAKRKKDEDEDEEEEQ